MKNLCIIFFFCSLANSKAEALFEHHITSDAIKTALAQSKEECGERVSPELGSSLVNLSKINSSIVKPKISFDLIDESIVRIEQQLGSVSSQINTLKEHVIEVKRAARDQADEEKIKADQLAAQLQEVRKQLAIKESEVGKLHEELQVKQYQLELSMTATNTPAHLSGQDSDHNEQCAQQ